MRVDPVPNRPGRDAGGPRRQLARAALIATLLTTACPRGGVRGGGDGAAGALAIPAAPGTERTLARLAEAGDAGDVTAAWQRAHYLVDLYDDARFRRDDASLELLRRATATPATVPRHGSAATDDAVTRLLVEVDRVLRLDRRHAGAQAARTLLEVDQTPAADRAALRQQMIELAAIAADGPLADNARLRQFGVCRRALGDAVRMRWAERPQAIAYCLYPLYPADPEPYFDPDPARRPPAPRWRDLTDDLTRLAASVAAGHRRLAPAGDAVTAELAAFVAASGAELPEPIDPDALALPRTDHAAGYDYTPLVVIAAGHLPASAEEVTGNVDAQLQGDGRATVALAMAIDADLDGLRRAAAGATAAGATWLELVYGVPQTLTVPEGDYWHGRLTSASVLVPGVVPLALSTAPPLASPDPRRPPHGPTWDPARAHLGLHLVVEPAAWRLVAETGEVGAVDTAAEGGDRGTELRVLLGRVRAAFADEAGLVVVPAPGAGYASLAEAVRLAAHDADGRPLFDRLALGSAAPAPRGPATLPQRIERRWRARVTLDPEPVRTRAAPLRACYQDLLEKRPTLTGTVTVRLAAGKLAAAGKPDPALAACAVDGLGPAMTDHALAEATVSFAPR